MQAKRKRQKGIRTLYYADETGSISRDLAKIRKEVQIPKPLLMSLLLEMAINKSKEVLSPEAIK